MDHEIRLKRLLYRSWHRGCKETDIVLGGFAQRHLRTLKSEMLGTYEALLEENDIDIWNWLTGQDTPKAQYNELLSLLHSYAKEAQES
jgi:antitoxin CptB